VNLGDVRRSGCSREVRQLRLKVSKIDVFGCDDDVAIFLLGNDLELELATKIIKVKGCIDFQQQWNAGISRRERPGLADSLSRSWKRSTRDSSGHWSELPGWPY
jgi:hypothetical protein